MVDLWPRIAISDARWFWLLILIPLLVFWHRRTRVPLPQWQLRALLGVRSMILLCLILCLCGVSLRQRSQDIFVVFALDQSRSIDRHAAEAARNWIRQATEGGTGLERISNDDWTILPFAEKAGSCCSDLSVVDRPHPSSQDESAGGLSVGKTTETSLRAALIASTAEFPIGRVPRMVLLTDGRQTVGDVLPAAQDIGMPVWTVPLYPENKSEILISRVEMPQEVARGETFDVNVLIHSSHEDTVIVEIRQDTAPPFERRRHSLKIGPNLVSFSVRIEHDALITASVYLENGDPEKSVLENGSLVSQQTGDTSLQPESVRDTIRENNSLAGYVYVTEGPRILLIEGTPGSARSLQQALLAEGLRVETQSSRQLPDSSAAIESYAGVVLENVPAIDLTAGQMEMLRDYVGRRGGGLLVVGGDQAFGPGGYYRTPIEDILPVACDFDKEQEIPSLAMILVIDKSGSMGGEKIELAKDAAKAAVELLSERDQIGITTFDGSAYVVSRLQSLQGRQEILNQIASIVVGGGTNLYPAMQQAYKSLQAAEARLKHVIVLTDGYSRPGDFESITRSMVGDRITVSAVGIGDADPQLMQLIARTGQGRYYFADDPASVPQIFARETVLAGRSAISETSFVPLQVSATPVMNGIDLTTAPELLGHVITRPRPSAEHVLHSSAGDPLLSWWRYGLGMSAVFTSDGGNRWAPEWVKWEAYSRFWSQVVRHCIRREAMRNIDFEPTFRENALDLTIQAVNDQGEFLNHATARAQITRPDGEELTVDLPQTASGEYHSEVTAEITGVWKCRATLEVDGKNVFTRSRAVVRGYSQELRPGPPDVDLLRTLAVRTNGIFNPPIEKVFAARDGEFADQDTPLESSLLYLALLLFVLDVVLQRVSLRKDDSEPVSVPQP